MTTNTSLFMKAAHPTAPLCNGIGRYVCQLQRLTIKFCKSRGDSRGIREFIENDLVDFAKNNSGIVVYCKPRRHRGALLVGEYLNGEQKWVCASSFTRELVIKWITLMKSQSGIPDHRIIQMWNTQHPSIQGPWTPITNRDPTLNLTKFPDERLSKTQYLPSTATEELLRIFEEQKKQEMINQ